VPVLDLRRINPGEIGAHDLRLCRRRWLLQHILNVGLPRVVWVGFDRLSNFGSLPFLDIADSLGINPNRRRHVAQ